MKKLILGFALTLFLGSYSVSANDGNPPKDKKAATKKECTKTTSTCTEKKACCKEEKATAKAETGCCKAKSTQTASTK